MRHKTILEKNLEKNTIIEERLGAALSKSSSGLSTKKRKAPEIEKRETQVRRRFGYRSHTESSTATVVLEAPSPTEEHSPSPDEIDAALESVQNAPSQLEEPPPAPAPAPSLQTVEPTPVPSVTPPPVPTEEFNLSPAKPYLVAYMGKLRDARNIIACDLEQANKHLGKYREVLQSAQRDVDSAELSVLTLGDNLEKIDKNLSECNILEGMCLEIAALLPHGSSTHKKAPHEPEALKERMSFDDPRLCRRADVLAIFRAEPQRSWSAREVVEALPAVKRANGKQNVPSHLSVLNNDGQIARVTKGVYTLAKAVETT